MDESLQTFLEFNFPRRFHKFTERLKKSQPQKKAAVFYSGAFVALFFLVVGGPLSSGPSYYFFLALLFFFWFQSNKRILTDYAPPEELYLIVFVLSGILEWALLNAVHFNGSGMPVIPYPQLFFHQLNWLLMVWSGGLLIADEGKKRQTGILAYYLLFVIGHYLIFYSHPFNKYLLFILLFFGLLKRTHWLERLSRIELAVYLIVLFILYANFRSPAYFDRALPLFSHFGKSVYFYSLPRFLYYFGKIYLIVLMIKIPVVLIYNYATISRKLWIAGLFQSTFPQIIQLLLLLFIFFLFIAGWQADNLRQEIYRLGQELNAGRLPQKPLVKKIPTNELFQKVKSTRIYSRDLGVSYLSADSTDQAPAYYLYFHPQNLTADSLFLMRVDSTLLRMIFTRTHLIVGSGLTAYRFKPSTFLAYLYRMHFWQSGPMRINPLGLIDPFMKQSTSNDDIVWFEGSNQKAKPVVRYRRTFAGIPVVVGRVFFSTGNDDEYFAIDIFYDLRDLFRWNFMSQILIILAIFFLFLNSLIIRRMVKFGSQINKLIIRKFALLRKGVRAIASGNLDYHVEMHGDDEFSEFADHFNQMSKELKRFMKEAREKERMNQELKIAHEVQLKMLPETLPKIPGFRMAADLTTANEVGGDFYDVFALDDRRFLLAIGDVSGKGMSAAFYMAQLISLLRYSTGFTTDLKALILRLNEYLVKNILDANIFVTAIIGILDASINEFTFIRAGHNHPVLIKTSQEPVLQEIKSKGLGLGLTRSSLILKKNLSIASITLQPKDKLILFTDGFTEASKTVNDQETIYGEERFFKRLKQCCPLSPQEYIECMKEDLKEFYAGAPQFDDQTIIVLEKE